MTRSSPKKRKRLTERQVFKIRWLSLSGYSTRELGAKFGVSAMQISRIVRRINWKSVA